jgi:hypothetical protein
MEGWNRLSELSGERSKDLADILECRGQWGMGCTGLDTPDCFCHISLQSMKLSGRNRSTFLAFLALGCLVGALAWEVLERIFLQLGFELTLGIGPVGFDLSVLSVYFKINPGTFIGLLGGIFLFRTV